MAHKVFEFINGKRQMVFEQGDVLAHALYTLTDELFVGGGDGPHHVAHVGIIEHGAMHNAAPRQMIECRATHLSVADHYIVAAAGTCVYAQAAKHLHHHIYIAAESETHVVLLCDV